jgi:oligoendopeptidase F
MAEVKTRDQIDQKYKWVLEDMYKTDQQWEDDFALAGKMTDDFAAYYGKLTESAEALLAALKALTELSLKVESIFTYARMRRDEDNASGLYQGMTARAMSLLVKCEGAASFVGPQLLAAPDGLIESYIKSCDGLKTYAFSLEKILRMKAHTLSESEEKLLAAAGEIAQAPNNVYSMLTDADMKHPTIKDENGEDVEITHGRFISLLESKNRDVRKAVYEAYYSTYKSFSNTIAATYSANVKADLFSAQARKYPSSLEAALFANNIPKSVYDNLIEAVHGGLDAMSEYMGIRKELLGVDELRYYDLYVPLFEYEGKVTYEQAQKEIEKSLAPLGERYISDSNRAYTDGWIDVFENRGKTSGAYSWGHYGVHPYILMNYQGTLDSMFTLSHELGHAMHSFYSDNNNDYDSAQYPIFLAEVASITNELLLIRYRIDKASSKEEKQYLLNYLLEQFRTTMFRQTMFAEFEMKAHAAAQEGHALTPDFLKDIYKELNLTYYANVAMDDYIPYEWSRIPHFYRAFYVYQYATGFAAAVKLSDDIYSGVHGAKEAYVEKFLSAGGSKFPVDILKDVGVDMTSTAVVDQALKFFTKTVEELKSTL